jgi:hypothetical protein
LFRRAQGPVAVDRSQPTTFQNALFSARRTLDGAR